MNIETGEIISLEEKESLPTKETKKYIPLTPELAKKLSRMNRHGRRAYYATHKEEFESVK